MTCPVYCINLVIRPDRKKNSVDNFKKLNIKNVIFPIFNLDIRGGSYGSYSSHIWIWKDFLKNYPDSKYCLIFEDDFKLTKNSKKYLKLGEKFIEKNYDKVDILNLHNFGTPIDNKINNKIFTNGFGSCTHAYYINRNYLNKVYTQIPEPSKDMFDYIINFDINSVLYTEKIFFTKNICFSQIDGETNNNWNFTGLKEVDAHYLGKNILNIMNTFNDPIDTKKIIMLLNDLKNNF